MNPPDAPNHFIAIFGGHIESFMSAHGCSGEVAGIISAICIATIVLLIATFGYWLIKLVIVHNVRRLVGKNQFAWGRHLANSSLFSRVAHLVPAIIIGSVGYAAFGGNPDMQTVVKTIASLYLLVVIVGIIYAVFDTLHDTANHTNFLSGLPLKGIVQAGKLLVFLIALILVVSILFRHPPLVILSGLGALTAVLMLVFKDVILGFTAGIMLSANQMIRIGDWIEMPSCGADGDVVDVTLTTVKVQNWDKTIVSVPAYNFISGAFKNWRGMYESGGQIGRAHV